ncbi:MAG: carbon storage regulator [Planctomycetaceae bacterium]
MLVLSRKKSESIVIGDDITIKVVRISGGRVRIAIDAPQHVKVSRGELFDPAMLASEPSDDLEHFEYAVS